VLDVRLNGAASPEAPLIAQTLHVVEDLNVAVAKASIEDVATYSVDEAVVVAVDGVAAEMPAVGPRDVVREPDSVLSTTSRAKVQRTGLKQRRTS